MKRGKLTLVAVVLSGSLLFSSCVGSFGLFNRLSSWNQSVGNKFVNELVFLAFNIVPVYGVAYLADALVINSIDNIYLLQKMAQHLSLLIEETGEMRVRTHWKQ